MAPFWAPRGQSPLSQLTPADITAAEALRPVDRVHHAIGAVACLCQRIPTGSDIQHTATIRGDLADYAIEVEWYDTHIGRALEHLIERDPDAYEITIFNAEPRVNYDRIMLSPVLSGEKAFADIVIHDDDWYERHGITLHRGCPVERIDREAKVVHGANGVTVEYDRLLIATGSSPIIIPVPGHDLPGVVAYRDLDDVDAMLAAAKAGACGLVGKAAGQRIAVDLIKPGTDLLGV